MENKLKLGTKLVHFFTGCVTREEAISTLAALLYEAGYVKDSYRSAVIEREKVFPTGLPTQPVGVAIPHTDTEHVISCAVAIGILSQPVVFQEMGSFDGEVNVEIMSMLAIPDPKTVMPILRQLALTYQDAELLGKLRDSSGPEMVVDLLKARIPEVIEVV